MTPREQLIAGLARGVTHATKVAGLTQAQDQPTLSYDARNLYAVYVAQPCERHPTPVYATRPELGCLRCLDVAKVRELLREMGRKHGRI